MWLQGLGVMLGAGRWWMQWVMWQPAVSYHQALVGSRARCFWGPGTPDGSVPAVVPP